MGLLDVLNGMQNGPRGERPARSGGGGMSPVTMALMGLLAYKAVKSFSGASAAAGQASPAPAENPGAEAGGGGLGGLLSRFLGGSGGQAAAPGAGSANPLGGVAEGTLVSGGLGSLLRDLQSSGHGQAAQSWVGNGPNQEIAPHDLEHALGAETIDALTAQTGMKRDDLLSALSQHLPELVNQLTPNGRVPTEEEAS